MARSDVYSGRSNMGDLIFDQDLLAFTLDDVAAFALSLDDVPGAQDDDLPITLYADELEDRLAAFSLAATFANDEHLLEQITRAQGQLQDALARWRHIQNNPVLALVPEPDTLSDHSPPPSQTPSPAASSPIHSGSASRASTPDSSRPTSSSSYTSLQLLFHSAHSHSRDESKLVFDDDTRSIVVESEPENDYPVSTTQCNACLCDVEDDSVVGLSCHHAYDIECMKQFFRAALADDLVFPPRCCGSKINLDDVRDQLPDDLVQQFEQKVEERDELLRVRCPSVSCARILGLQTELPPSVACSACHTVVCTTCRAAHDPGMTCAQHEDALPIIDLARQQLWQRCNACRRFVERTEGCWHMSCLCGAQFCYVCAARWKTCSCPQFPVPDELRE